MNELSDDVVEFVCLFIQPVRLLGGILLESLLFLDPLL